MMVKNLLIITLLNVVSFVALAHDAEHNETQIVPFPQVNNTGPANGLLAYQKAEAFLTLLSAPQKLQLVLPVNSTLRSNWSNLPAGVLRFERNGLRLGDLNQTQLQGLFSLLQATLSKNGYDTLSQIVTADKVLSREPAAKRFAWTEENYWIALFGEPSKSKAWGIQFGGHHLAVNIAYEQGKVISLSPTFIGIEPSEFEYQGIPSAPMNDELQDALALMNSLPEELQQKARVKNRAREVYTGPQKDGFIPPLEGGKIKNWSPEHQQELLSIIHHWVGLQPTENTTLRMQEIKQDIDETYFAWHGKTDGNSAIYFRIQGQRLILEFSTEGSVGSDVGHYHSVYRNPTLEYGLKSEQ